MTAAQSPRRRCVTCRRYFGFQVIEGLYCSFLCQGWSMEEIEEAWRLHWLSKARRDARREKRREREIPAGVKVPRQCRTDRMLYKVRYTSIDEAVARARDMGDDAEAYLCPHCRHFHTGHKLIEGAKS